MDCDWNSHAYVRFPLPLPLSHTISLIANLLGLQHGQGSELQYPDDPEESQPPGSESTDDEQSMRQWTRDDRQDLNKLGTMMAQFLGVPQFSADPKLFERLVIAPLMATGGPRPGAVQVLTQVMETTMIRHRSVHLSNSMRVSSDCDLVGRVDDIENDVLLPFMSCETILLDLDPYALMSYNAMQAMIAVNAVDSERKDQVRTQP